MVCFGQKQLWSGYACGAVIVWACAAPAALAQTQAPSLRPEPVQEETSATPKNEPAQEALISNEPMQDESAQAEAAQTLNPLEIFGDRGLGDPGSLAHIESAEIALLRADHPAELLNTVPGVNIQMNSGQETLPAIRSPVLTLGAGQGSILLLENGVPLRAAPFGNVNALFETNINTADLIEVIRGPGSAQYGANAVHGIVNIIAPEPLDALQYRVSASGSHLGRWQIKSVGQGLIPGLKNALTLYTQIDQGWRESSSLNEQKMSFQLAGDYQGWDLYSYTAATRLDQQTAGFLANATNEPAAYLSDIRENPNPDAFRRAWSARTHIRAAHDLAGGELVLTPYAAFQEMHFSQHFLPNGSEERNGQYLGGMLARYQRDIGPVELSFGLSGEGADSYLLETQAADFSFFDSDLRFPSGTHYDYRVVSGIGAAWLEAVVTLPHNLRALAAFRGEIHNYSYKSNIPATTPLPEGAGESSQSRFQVIPDRSDLFGLYIPKFGIIWSGLSWAELFFNYSAGGRAPQASDLYRLQSQQTAGEFSPESIHSIEFGGRGNVAIDTGTSTLAGVSYALSGYWMHKTNVHFRDSNRLNFSGGRTEHYGIDASIRGEWGPLWTGLSVAWAVHAYDFTLESNGIVQGNRIDTAPEWLVDFNFGYTSERLNARADLEYIGSYFTDGANQHTYPGHVVLHVRGDWKISERANIFLTMRNLLDTRYADRADFAFGSERYFPGEPFNATFGIGFTY